MFYLLEGDNDKEGEGMTLNAYNQALDDLLESVESNMSLNRLHEYYITWGELKEIIKRLKVKG